jgi:hypothetical protein
MRHHSITLFVVAMVASCTTSSDDTTCPRDEPMSCPTPSPSYAADVAPLIETYCSPCHNPQGSAFNIQLSTYTALYDLRSEALDQIYDCNMPMLPALQPTTADRVTLLAWFVCGAPDN